MKYEAWRMSSLKDEAAYRLHHTCWAADRDGPLRLTWEGARELRKQKEVQSDETDWFHYCRFERLFEANVDSSEMTPGQMLLMGFAGMYSRLDADFKALVDAASAVQIIDKYKKADLVREAAMLQVMSIWISYMALWVKQCCIYVWS